MAMPVLHDLKLRVHALQDGVMRDPAPLSVISAHLGNKNLSSLAFADKARRDLLRPELEKRRQAELTIAWRRVLERNTWVAEILDDKTYLEMTVTVCDHARGRTREVTVCNFDRAPFTYGYLSEVVSSALGDDETVDETVRSGTSYRHGDHGVWTTTRSRCDRSGVDRRIMHAIRFTTYDTIFENKIVHYHTLTAHTQLPRFGTVYFKDERTFGVLDMLFEMKVM